jgi:hypothetical protein
MKTFQAYLMAEFRRALPFLPWLLGLHAMTLGARTRWAGEFSNQLVAMIEWTSWAIALLVAVTSLWHDAPLRRERFLSTRPQRFLPLLFAKWIALTVIIVLPFGLVDFLALKSGGFSGKFLWLGTLQTLLLFLAALCALFPAVWWWRSVSTAFIALGVTFAALLGSGFLLSRQPGNLNLHNGEALGFPMGPMLVLVFLATLAISSAVFLPLLRKPKDLIRIPVFALLACLSLWLSLWVSIRPPKADETVKPTLVAIKSLTPGYPAALYEWFTAETPAIAPELDIDVSWSFSKLMIDGRDARSWKGGQATSDPSAFQPRHALARHFGEALADPSAEPAYHFPNIAILPGGIAAERNHEIEFELQETHYRWELLVDMPLKRGATAKRPDGVWSVTTYEPGVIPGKSNDPHETTRIAVRSIVSNLWLDTKAGSNGISSGAQDLVYIVDPDRGEVMPLQRVMAGSIDHTSNNLSRKQWEYAILLWGDYRIQEAPNIDFSKDLRVAVIRPQVVRRISHSWKSPRKVRLQDQFMIHRRTHTEGNGLPWLLASELLASPEAAGLSLAEWLDYFRLNPSALTYKILSETFVPRDRMDHEVDQWLRNFRVRPRHVFISPGIELALARGRQEAPRWLKEDFEARFAVSTGRNASAVNRDILRTFFNPPELNIAKDGFDVMERQLDWFLAADPDRFVFDPATRKYQLRNNP